MTDIKWNDGKIVFGEDGFEVNSGDVNSPEEYGGRTHDETDALKTIGAGSQKTIHLDPTILADEGYIDLPAETSGRGFILIGDAEYWVDFEWDQYNAVQLIDGTSSSNPYNADEDDKFCIFDNSGDSDTVRIKNRLGVAKRIMFDATYTEEPLAPTFQAFAEPSGVDNLDPSLTINGVTVTPTFRYFGGDANATNWVAAGYGETLTRVAVVTPPTYNDGSPGLGSNDDSVKFNGSDYYKTTGTDMDITTGDYVFECVYKIGSASIRVAATRTTGVGWLFYSSSSSEPYFYIQDSGGAVANAGGVPTVGTWVHVMVFGDRSGSSQIYVNSVASGSAANISAINGTLASGVGGAIGARPDGDGPFDSNVAYVALWESAAWLDTHLQADVAKERFRKLCGIYPEIAHNSANLLVDGNMEGADVSAWTAVESTLTKDTTAPLYEGTKHLRITSTANTFWAYQSIFTVGVTYRITGAARSVSDSAIPSAISPGIDTIWTGTTSTDWQEFNVEYVVKAGAGPNFYIGSASNHPGVVDFDDVTVTCLGYIPITAERTYPAYLDKMEGDYRKLYYVGSEWLRMCRRWDSLEEKVEGYLPETAAQNLIIESEDFLTTWTLLDAGDIVLNDQVVCPDGRTKAASIGADNTNGVHGVTISFSLGVGVYALSVFVKPGDRDWVCLLNAGTAACSCYFDVANGVVGTAGANCVGYIEGPFYGDFYRCCIVYTRTTAGNTLSIYPSDSDGDLIITGDVDNTPNIYVWGAQIELGDYMTSPVRTAGSALTRVKDNLQFVAGANIGGEDVGQGTIRLDILHPACQIEAVTASLRYPFSINDGGAAADRVFGYVANDEKWYAESRASGENSGTATTVGICADNTKHTVGVTWNSNNLVAYRDGVTLLPDTACDMPDDLDTIMFSAFDAGRQFKGLIQNFRIYNIPTTKG